MKKEKKPVEQKEEGAIKKENLTKVKANHAIYNTQFNDIPTLIGCNEVLMFNKEHLRYYRSHVTVLDKVKQTKDIPGSDEKKKVKAI